MKTIQGMKVEIESLQETESDIKLLRKNEEAKQEPPW